MSLPPCFLPLISMPPAFKPIPIQKRQAPAYVRDVHAWLAEQRKLDRESFGPRNERRARRKQKSQDEIDGRDFTDIEAAIDAQERNG